MFDLRTSVVATCLAGVLVSTGACMAEGTGGAARVTEEMAVESPKRRVPSVSPVSSGGIRYEAVRGAKGRGFDQNGGIVAAIDEASGDELWVLVVYRTTYDPMEEADVQDVFITELSLSDDGHRLIVENERKEMFEVNLADRSVTEVSRP